MNIIKPISLAEQMSNAIITHDAYAKAVNGCIKIIQSGERINRSNRGIAIMGSGGTGKTTAIEHLKGYLNKKYAGQFNAPVLLTKVSSDTTIKSFYIGILGELNHPITDKREDKNITADKLQKLVVCALKGHVGTLFIDEVSDVFSNRNKKQFAQDFLVMIKHLLSDTSINIILVGTPALEQLFEIADEQFRTRFPSKFELPIFAMDTSWVRLLNDYVAQTTNIYDISILPNLFSQLHEWTGGNLRNLANLLTTAIDVAEQEKAPALTAQHLLDARDIIFPSLMAA
jgi:GTPase SAR1 family protein